MLENVKRMNKPGGRKGGQRETNVVWLREGGWTMSGKREHRKEKARENRKGLREERTVDVGNS